MNINYGFKCTSKLMKNLTPTILPLLLLLCSSYIHSQQTDINDYNVLGDVVSIMETKYYVPMTDDNFENETLVYQTHTIFNTEGNKQKSSINKSGTLFSYVVYNYDHNNIQIGKYEYNADSSLYLTITFKRDKNGFKTEALYNRILQKTYDSQRLSLEVEFDKYYNNLFTRIVYINDYKGHVTEEKYLTEDNILSFMYTYKYDYLNNKIEIKYYNSKGIPSWRQKLKYNSMGRVIQSKLYKGNRIAMTSKYSYENDQCENWIKRIETRKLFDNFFSYDLSRNTVITNRIIEYY